MHVETPFVGVTAASMTLPNKLSLACKTFMPLPTSVCVDSTAISDCSIFTESSVSISRWRNMSYTHSNAGYVNPFGTNQVFKQCRLVGLCVLSLLGLIAMNSVQAANECDSFLSCCDTGENCRQFYLGGIVGADFGTLHKVPGDLTAVPNQSLFTAGGTVGMRSLRDNGAWRFEFEGRGRDQISGTVTDPASPDATLNYGAVNGWSTIVNIWRDYNVVGDVDIYAGAGIGAGGYRAKLLGIIGPDPQLIGNDNVANFAWQAGGGVIYNASNRVALDLGYRFFSINETSASSVDTVSGNVIPYSVNYAASELLLTLRIYEPFRRWR